MREPSQAAASAVAVEGADEPGPCEAQSLSAGALVFLRGRDADARLRELVAGRLALRPVLGKLANAFLSRRLYHALGYRCLGDWAREKLGMGDRVVREWARVHGELAELPRLRAAVEGGEVPWSVARRVVNYATPETDAAVLESVRGRSLRAVETMVRSVREAEGKAAQAPEVEEADGDGDRVAVRLAESPQAAGMWHVACELARRMAGEELPTWACADKIAAEGSTVFGADDAAQPLRLAEPGPRRSARDHAERDQGQEKEDGRRELAWPHLRWAAPRARAPQEITALGEDLDDPSLSPLALARRLQTAVSLRQTVDHEIGRLLRQVADRKLHRELGFSTFARFVEERLDMAPRTARRLVRLARAEHRAPAVADAFRSGELTAMQAEALLRVVGPMSPESAERWVAWAHQVTLRRLERDTDAVPKAAIAFHAPRDVAAFFLGVLKRAGSLEKLLAHVIATWTQEGDHWDAHAVIARDGFRCTAPACRARSKLESHHILYKGRGGPRTPLWNQTTLCWWHHHQGEHGGRMAVWGRAADDLGFELGGERYRSGDRRMEARITKENAPPRAAGRSKGEGGGSMMGGERLDISVRNVASTAAP